MTRPIQIQRLALRCRLGSRRLKTPSASTTERQQTKSKWTEREDAPRWLQKMAPTKGGTSLPTTKEAAVIVVVARKPTKACEGRILKSKHRLLNRLYLAGPWIG